MATNTLKGTNWIVTHEESGSRGVLSFNNDTTGTFTNGPSQSNIVWGETWVGNSCALWVVFKSNIDQSIIRIWGIQMTMQGGTGMSAFGNAQPQDLSNTTFINENLTIAPQQS